MTSVKEAVVLATKFAGELDLAWREGVRLEEVETSTARGKDIWLVTLSIPSESFILKPQRNYKVFAVDKETGEVLSMKIREFAGVND